MIRRPPRFTPFPYTPLSRSHFAALTFDPATLATVVPDGDHNFEFDVTGETPGEGTLEVGFGHDDHADEVIFETEDRKSTRLNSSHANISYAVFCLKKKKIKD